MVTILGFTFKENIPDTRNSGVAGLYQTLMAAGAEVPGAVLYGPSDETVDAPLAKTMKIVRGPRRFAQFKALDPNLNQVISHMMDLPADALLSLPRLMQLLKDWQASNGAQEVLPSVREQVYINQFFSVEKKWQRLKNDAAIRKKFLTLFENPAAAEAWFEKSIDALAEWQIRASRLGAPEGLVHGDLRLDNFIFTGERAYAVDWPNACFGPFVFDQMFLFSNLEAEGFGKTEELTEQFGSYISDDAVAMLASLSGYFADQAYREVPERMPRLRWMQKSMLLAQLKCLSRLGIIESIPRMTDENQ